MPSLFNYAVKNTETKTTRGMLPLK